jgi:hypothetical protein
MRNPMIWAKTSDSGSKTSSASSEGGKASPFKWHKTSFPNEPKSRDATMLDFIKNNNFTRFPYKLQGHFSADWSH